MFGKLFNRDLVIRVLLLGFCLYIIKLYVQDNITHYIHPRYAIFSVAMSGVAVLVLLTGAVLELKKRTRHKANNFSGRTVNSIVVVVLVLAFILPVKTLSSEAIERKSLNTPTYDEVESEDSSSRKVEEKCPETKPDSLETWVFEISQNPAHCYVGQDIELTGFVYESDKDPLPSDMYYLGRIVMSCCAVDARPYALPIKKANFQSYPKETWLKVNGKLQLMKVGEKYQLVIEPASVEQVHNPKKPYDYINTPSNVELEPLQLAE